MTDDPTDEESGGPAGTVEEDDADVEGHGLPAALGLNELRKVDQRPLRSRPEPELPPLTRRFPDMRDDRRGSRGKG